jgi:hypothetical protein
MKYAQDNKDMLSFTRQNHCQLANDNVSLGGWQEATSE